LEACDPGILSGEYGAGGRERAGIVTIYPVKQPLSAQTTHLDEQDCCYSVDRPIMRASHVRDWGSNPHSSIPFFLHYYHSDLADLQLYPLLFKNSWRNPADGKKMSLKVQTQKNPALFSQLWSKLRAIIK
jgi:hypothetical protein